MSLHNQSAVLGNAGLDFTVPASMAGLTRTELAERLRDSIQAYSNPSVLSPAVLAFCPSRASLGPGPHTIEDQDRELQRRLMVVADWMFQSEDQLARTWAGALRVRYLSRAERAARLPVRLIRGTELVDNPPDYAWINFLQLHIPDTTLLVTLSAEIVCVDLLGPKLGVGATTWRSRFMDDTALDTFVFALVDRSVDETDPDADAYQLPFAGVHPMLAVPVAAPEDAADLASERYSWSIPDTGFRLDVDKHGSEYTVSLRPGTGLTVQSLKVPKHNAAVGIAQALIANGQREAQFARADAA